MYSLIILFPPQKKPKIMINYPSSKMSPLNIDKTYKYCIWTRPRNYSKVSGHTGQLSFKCSLRLTWQEVFQKTSGLFWTIRSSLSVNDSVPPAAPGIDRSDYHSAVFPCPWLFLSDAARASVAFSGTWAPCSSSKARSLSYDDLVTCRPHGYLPVCSAAYLHASLPQTTRRVLSFPISLL